MALVPAHDAGPPITVEAYLTQERLAEERHGILDGYRVATVAKGKAPTHGASTSISCSVSARNSATPPANSSART